MCKTIIHLLDYGPEYSGNFISSIIKLDRTLKPNGKYRQILVFTDKTLGKDWLKEIYNENISVYFIPKGVNILQRTKQIREIIKKEEGHIIHSHFSYFDSIVGALSMLYKVLGKDIKSYWHMHSDFPKKNTLYGKIKLLIKYRMIGRLVNIITVSNKLKKDVENEGFSSKNVFLLHNGIDTERATNNMLSIRELKKEVRIDNDTVLFLAFGTKPQIKGIDILLDAMEMLYKDIEDKAKLLIVGKSELVDYLNHRYNNNYPKWLNILPPKENVADYYSLSDVFVSSSRGEGFSYSVGEAMANGVPIISSDIPGLHWTKEAEGVKFFESENPIPLYKLLKQMSSLTSKERKAIGNYNISYIENNYSISKWVDNIIKIYNKD